MEKTADIFKWIAESLRYLLSGGAAIIVLILVHKKHLNLLEANTNKELASAIAILALMSAIGYLVYYFHRALVFPLFHIIVMHYVKKTTYLDNYSVKPEELDVHNPSRVVSQQSKIGSIKETLHLTDMMTDIRLARLKYLSKDILQGAEIRHLDRWASSVHALYCCAWSSAFITMIALTGVIKESENLGTALIISIGLLIASVTHHIRFLKEELRLYAIDITKNMIPK